MRYLLLIYEEPPPATPSEAELGAMMAELRRVRQLARRRRAGFAAARRSRTPSPTRPRSPSGTATRIVTDGPFAETKEHLGGYYLIDAPDLDAAIEAAARDPGRAGPARSRSGRSWRWADDGPS